MGYFWIRNINFVFIWIRFYSLESTVVYVVYFFNKRGREAKQRIHINDCGIVLIKCWGWLGDDSCFYLTLIKANIASVLEGKKNLLLKYIYIALVSSVSNEIIKKKKINKPVQKTQQKMSLLSTQYTLDRISCLFFFLVGFLEKYTHKKTQNSFILKLRPLFLFFFVRM